MNRRVIFRFTLWLATGMALTLNAANPPVPPSRGDQALADYFRVETAKLSKRCLADIQTLDDWNARRAQYRQQLFDMLGLSPLPPRTELKAVVTGKVEHDQFTVENLHFQSLPGLYVTANLYRPKNLAKPVPAVLYLSGHGPVISNGVSYGNKVSYQHHGAWFARHGYVCLVLDSLQLGEILGLHHGTYREDMWWWNARGYTPAGVEAWNCIRALDYLATRADVDTNRFGATGRSGGGAYSWWIAALDDRIRAAAPVAGITDLHNHVVDGTVEGHCDCMFTVNMHRWDYPLVAALVAPRPLLLVNTDDDSIFPLDGVQRTFALARKVYDLHGAKTKLGLVIGPGPHKDTQDLQVPVFRWFNRHLKGEDPLIETAATSLLRPEQLKVFSTLPPDSINTNIHETFVPSARSPIIPQTSEAWRAQRDAWMTALREKVFAGWPEASPPLELKPAFSVERSGLKFQAWDFTSQPQVQLRLYAMQRTGGRKPERAVMTVLDAAGFEAWLGAMQSLFVRELTDELTGQPAPPDDERGFAELREQLLINGTARIWLAPRGIGLTAWNPDPKKQIQIRRRFMLLGQTLDGMRVWDIRRALQAARAVKSLGTAPLTLEAGGEMGVNAVYASLFEPGLTELNLRSLPASHRQGPDYLNVLRVLDVPQAVAMAAAHAPVQLHQADAASWSYPAAVANAFSGSGQRFVLKLNPLKQN